MLISSSYKQVTFWVTAGGSVNRCLFRVLVVSLMFCPRVLWSQQIPVNPPRLSFPQGGVPGGTDLGGGEEQTQTIEKCLRDLASEDVDARLRAVMILAKYPTDNRAVAALIGAVKDTEVRVRRAAVVSLGENEIPLPQAADALLRTLGDKDVEVRRLTSSMLPRIVMSLPLTRSGNPSLSGTTIARAFPEAAKPLIIAAFADEDSVVRRNMLGNESLLQGIVDASVVQPLLRDSVPETRALALDALVRRLPADTFVDIAMHLVTDKDPHVRQALARSLSRAQSARSAAGLHQLLSDPAPAVAAAAAEGLFLMQKPISRDRLMQLIESRDIDSKLAVRLISYYPIVDEDCRETILALTKHPRSDFRAAALSTLARSRGKFALDSARALEFLNDTNQEVRRAAQRILYANHDLGPEQLTDLIASPFVDVRQFVLSASRTVNRDAAKEILYELLLDESTAVRGQVIAEFARQRFPDALEILAASLDDDSIEIKRAALNGLFQLGTEESVKVLQTFAKETRDANLRTLVLSVLANRARLRRTNPPVHSPGSTVPR